MKNADFPSQEMPAADPYKLLRACLHKNVGEEIRTGQYAHLRPTPHNNKPRMIEPSSRFRFNIFPFESFTPNHGDRSFTFSPLEIVFCVYGKFSAPSNPLAGFNCNPSPCYRVGVGLNAVIDADSLKDDIAGRLDKIKFGLHYSLLDGRYSEFISMVTPIIDGSIERFKRDNAKSLPLVFH